MLRIITAGGVPQTYCISKDQITIGRVAQSGQQADLILGEHQSRTTATGGRADDRNTWLYRHCQGHF
eukprot:SAG31_NODE_5067_length_2761_cov_53.365890_3_plen_67_part_00